MKDFIVFAGPNGSGKSSVRDAIANPVEVVIDPDRIARSINPSDPLAQLTHKPVGLLFSYSTTASPRASRSPWKQR